MARRPGRVVARQQYFAAAIDVLAHEGASGLRIAPLCRALGVTSGSFYHHFAGWAGFVAALLEHWEAEQTARVVELAAAVADPRERIEVLKHLTVALPHAAEAAIRSWAAIDVEVGRAQRRVDEQRLRALERVIGAVVDDPRVATRLAVLGMSILVGFQQMISPVDVGLLRELFDDYQGLVLRHAAPR